MKKRLMSLLLLVGMALSLLPAASLRAMAVGGSLLGLVGVLISVPIASVIYTLLRRDIHKRLGPPDQA